MLHSTKSATATAWALLLLFVAFPSLAFSKSLSERFVYQTAMVLKAEDVHTRHLPVSLRVPGLPVIYASQVSLACMPIPAWKDELVVFLPAKSSCIPLAALFATTQVSHVNPGDLMDLRGDRAKLKDELENRDFVVIQARVRADNTPVKERIVTLAEACSCPNNIAPVVTVTSAASQQAAVGTAIASIGFSATDTDSEVLTDYFSYSLNGGTLKDGLPAGLSGSCISGTGTLNCNVTGTAPTIPGAYLISLEVIDGFNRVSKTASLTVTGTRPPGGILVSAISGDTSENGVTATFTVVLENTPTDNISIDLSSSDTGEGTVSPTNLTFTPANWATPKQVTVTGVEDMEKDGTVAYRIVMGSAVSTDSFYAGINASDVRVFNLDNDTSASGHPSGGVTVSDISGDTSEDGATAKFTVVLDNTPTGDVIIDLSSSDPGEGTVLPGSLTFTAVNWASPQQVNVTGVDDTIEDGKVAYSIITHPTVSTDPFYSGINATDVSVFNLDNDANSLGCNDDYVQLDKNSLVIKVQPNGLDDTENVQCALNAAAGTGVPVVRLAAGDFNVSYLYVVKFNGSLQGTTRASTRLNILDGSIDCAAMSSQGLTPSAIKFSQGEPSLKFMQITANSPCMTGEPLRNLIHFTGRGANDPSCGISVINGKVDRVDIIGPGRAGYITIAIAASAEGEYLGGCNVVLLGGIKVNFSSVTDARIGVLTAMRSSAQVDINFSNFLQNAYAIVLLDSRQSTTVISNVIDSDGVEPTIAYAAGIFVVTSVPDAPAKTRLVIHNNRFTFRGTTPYPADVIKVSEFGDSTQEVSVSVTSNVFNLSGSNIAGFWGVDLDSATISANVFNGFGFAAIGLEVDKLSSVSGTTITSNRGLEDFIGAPGDILIGPGVMRTFVGDGQNATTIDEGVDSLILSISPVDDDKNPPRAATGRTSDTNAGLERLMKILRHE